MSSLIISLVQSHTVWHDPKANRELFETLILSHKNNSDLFLLPEVFTSGFTMEAKPYAESMEGPTVERMKAWAAQTNAAIMGSLLIADEGRYFNRLVCTFPDGSTQHYDKRHLFSYSKEDEIVSGGNERLIIEWRGWRICPLICYDLRFPAWSRNNENYDLLVYLANWPAARSYAWNQLLKARAIENQCFLAAVNRTGEDGRGLTYDGDSVVIDYAGKLLLSCGKREEVKTITIKKGEMNAFRSTYPFLVDQDHFTIQT